MLIQEMVKLYLLLNIFIKKTINFNYSFYLNNLLNIEFPIFLPKVFSV